MNATDNGRIAALALVLLAADAGGSISDRSYHGDVSARTVNAPILLAAGVEHRVDRRQDRRQDAVENTGDRLEDKQDFREQRRDCVGDGPDCRSDNRQDKRQDTVNRGQDRVQDRRDRR